MDRAGSAPAQSPAPRVSIGLPVYNGANFVEQAIISILGQSFGDFELIISDNASTDDTGHICRRFADGDPRIRYHRTERNIGGSPNYNRLVGLARGEYFKWAAHDDLCRADFLEESVRALDGDPSAVLCCSIVQVIDEHGQRLYESRPRRFTDSPDPRVRFAEVTADPDESFEQYGLIRTSVLRDTPLIGPYPGSDQVLVAALALKGRFHQILRPLNFIREHPARYTRAALTGSAAWQNPAESIARRVAWHKPGRHARVALPKWRVIGEIARTVARSNLDLRTTLCCSYDLAKRAWWFRTVLARDLEAASQALFHRKGAAAVTGTSASSASRDEEHTAVGAR